MEQYFESFDILYPQGEKLSKIKKISHGVYNAVIKLNRGQHIKPKLVVAVMQSGLISKMYDCPGETKEEIIEQVRNSNQSLFGNF